MYYKIDNRIYTEQEIAGKTFHEHNKPEPVFTLEEAKDLFIAGIYCESGGAASMDRYFKQQFNISI